MTIAPAVVDSVLAQFEQGEVSLHSADPGLDGANELRGNRYARLRAQWERTGDSTCTSVDLLFTGLPRGMVAAVGFWNGGRFLGYRPVTPRDTQAGDGYRLPAGYVQIFAMEVE